MGATVSGAPPDPDRVPRGWHAEVWRLRCTLLSARERLPWASAEAQLLNGVERYLRIYGRGKTAAGEWWANSLALTKAAAACCGRDTRDMLAPWTGLVFTPAVAGTGFRPVGCGPVDET